MEDNHSVQKTFSKGGIFINILKICFKYNTFWYNHAKNIFLKKNHNNKIYFINCKENVFFSKVNNSATFHFSKTLSPYGVLTKVHNNDQDLTYRPSPLF